MRTFVAGPDCGLEFGWLVSRWVPAVRAKSRSYEKAVIICRKGHEALYKDFADKFIFYSKSGKCDRWLLNGKVCKQPRSIKEKYPGAKFWVPEERTCQKKPREHIKYGNGVLSNAPLVLIHARAVTRYGQGKLNWPVENYRKLVRMIKKTTPLVKVCSIGRHDSASYIKGTVDYRGVGLQELMDLMASAWVTVGTSSGPMHLASMCGCPHVVMTGASKLKILKGQTNRDRYERLWNPHSTSVTVVDEYGWKPPVKPVFDAVEEYL